MSGVVLKCIRTVSGANRAMFESVFGRLAERVGPCFKLYLEGFWSKSGVGALSQGLDYFTAFFSGTLVLIRSGDTRRRKAWCSPAHEENETLA